MPQTDVARLLGELTAWADAAAWPVETIRYGDGPDHVLDVRLPRGGAGTRAAVLLLHGGFWRERYRRDLMDALSVDLARRGHVACNAEYRRVGAGGGVPQTLADVAAAVAYVRDQLAPPRLVALGHSAGGQLALWAAGEPGVDGAVALAGVCDLAGAARERLGDGAAIAFAGGTPEERPEAYALADPLARPPVASLLAHGTADDVVPPEQSRRYAAANPDACELLELRGVGHYEPIDPRSGAWAAVAERL